jgi:hypothetical protein
VLRYRAEILSDWAPAFAGEADTCIQSQQALGRAVKSVIADRVNDCN